MRNLLLLLLLANVLYFLYEQFVAAPDDTGVAVVSEDQLGPPLMLADAVSAENAGGDAEPMNPGMPSELQAVVGRSCVSIGPFRDDDEASGALADYEADGMRGALRPTRGDVFVGHWVQIRNLPDRAAANQMLATLKEGGLDEAYIVQTEDEGIKISIGLFSDLGGAERVELQAKSMGLPAEITARTREQDVFFVDLGLPPGRGAGSMIERYGEERVMLRDAATCPGQD